MMKQLLLSCLILVLVHLTAYPQNLWVYSFNGGIEIRSASGWKPAELYQRLSPSDSIRFGINASISILDRKNDKLYAIQKNHVASVEELLNEVSRHTNKQPKSVVSYLWQSLTGKNTGNEFRSSAGVVYRNDDVNYALASAVASSTSTFPVDFTLLDRETGCSVNETATVGNSALIQVNNHSAQDLFINVIDVDANGNMVPCIPVTSAQIMTQLFIPANSEVLLDSFPIVFTEPRGEDTLILVASPELFDAGVVVNALKTGKGTTRKIDVGVFKVRLTIR